MEIYNNQIFSKFITPEATKPVQGYLSSGHCGERSDEAIHKPINSTNVCINTAIVAGAGATSLHLTLHPLSDLVIN
jgi:hypothetical protein